MSVNFYEWSEVRVLLPPLARGSPVVHAAFVKNPLRTDAWIPASALSLRCTPIPRCYQVRVLRL